MTLVKKYEERFSALRVQALAEIDDVFHPAQLARLASAIKEIVVHNPNYWRLMYIDVVEFGNKHFAHAYRGWSEQVARTLGARLEKAAAEGPWGGMKPALAFTIIYLQFFTYFLVETPFRGNSTSAYPRRKR